jgi:predicted nucleic acid-binding protein
VTAPSAFVDTNVLVYTVDDGEPIKRQQALTALAALDGRFMLSAQVLGELYVTLTRKLARPVDAAQAVERVAGLSRHRVVAVDGAMVRSAIETSQRSQISYWDALIVEAAVKGGCAHILTEDLATGAVIRGVEIVNPFA